MKKQPYTAARLIKEITDLCDHHGVCPKDVTIFFRRCRDSDPITIHQTEEDLYNENDNSTLQSIMLLNDPADL